MGWVTTGARPIHWNVIAKLDCKRDKYGSIIIPDTAQRQPQMATVIAVGEEVKEIAPRFRILVGKWNGRKLPPPDDDPEGEYYVLNADPDLKWNADARISVMEVYGIIEDEPSEKERTMIVPD